MTDIDEMYINSVKDLTKAMNRVAEALETHLPAIAAGPVPPAAVEPPAPPADGA